MFLRSDSSCGVHARGRCGGSGGSDPARAGADRPQAALVRQDKPELRIARETLSDQLAVARLEDVQGNAFGGKEDQLERE